MGALTWLGLRVLQYAQSLLADHWPYPAQAPGPSRMAVHRLIASSCSLAARGVSQACRSNCAAASFVDDEEDRESGPTRNG